MSFLCLETFGSTVLVLFYLQDLVPYWDTAYVSLQLPNPDEPRQHSLSTVDGQMGSRTKSYLPGNCAKRWAMHI